MLHTARYRRASRCRACTQRMRTAQSAPRSRRRRCSFAAQSRQESGCVPDTLCRCWRPLQSTSPADMGRTRQCPVAPRQCRRHTASTGHQPFQRCQRRSDTLWHSRSLRQHGSALDRTDRRQLLLPHASAGMCWRDTSCSWCCSPRPGTSREGMHTPTRQACRRRGWRHRQRRRQSQAPPASAPDRRGTRASIYCSGLRRRPCTRRLQRWSWLCRLHTRRRRTARPRHRARTQRCKDTFQRVWTRSRTLSVQGMTGGAARGRQDSSGADRTGDTARRRPRRDLGRGRSQRGTRNRRRRRSRLAKRSAQDTDAASRRNSMCWAHSTGTRAPPQRKPQRQGTQQQAATAWRVSLIYRQFIKHVTSVCTQRTSTAVPWPSCFAAGWSRERVAKNHTHVCTR
jgi:hypothetical protein